MSTPRIIARSVLWNHAGKVLEYAMMYVASVLIARGLGIAGNGLYAALISVAQLLFAVSSLGFETSLNKHIPQLGEDNPQGKTRFLLRRILLVRICIFLGSAAVLAGVFSIVRPASLVSLEPYLWLLLLYSGARSITPIFAVTLVAKLRTDLNAKITIAVRVLELMAIITLLPDRMSVSNLLIVFVCGSVLQIAGYVLLDRGVVFGAPSKIPLRPVLIFGAIFWGNTLVDFFLGRQGDILLLTTLRSDSIQTSLYDVAYSLIQVATLGVTVGLTGVTLATFSRLASNASTTNRFYGFMVRIVSLGTVPLYAFVFVNAGSLVHLVYTTEYAPAILPLRIMAGFRLVARLFGGGENADYLLSAGRVRTLTLIGVAAAGANIAMDVALIPTYGAGGAAVAGGVGNIIANIVAAILIWRITGVGIQGSFWVMMAVLSIGAAGLAQLLADLPGFTGLALRAVLFIGLLLAGMTFTRPLHREDAEWLTGVDPRLHRLLRYFTRTVPSKGTS